jgi:hypothetical protein
LKNKTALALVQKIQKELTAKNMIKKGCDNSFINEITGLSLEKIEELRRRES